ncbi:MAG: zinc-binding dehydrogenase [Pleurocapsa minor GSE-CHR-MK-17-07R]|jgi:NADPH:quinone reductase-like Zn-dependent oxidoreductase|nr:zinc-binding dehydrogenase [Pleurocapsa minor GSE-CHR-MK 17-07R]
MTDAAGTHTRRAAILRDYVAGYGHLSIETASVLPPDAHEVVVAVDAAPIHPADLMFLQGRYGVKKSLPVAAGFECVGHIVAVGRDIDPARIGERVCALASDKDGTWATLTTTRASQCFPVPADMPDAFASMLAINPLSAWALVDMAAASGAGVIVQTAASSALGKMIIHLCARRGIDTINIIRNDDHIPALQAAGARYILNSGEPTFDKHLRELCRTLDVRMALDAVAGDVGGRVLRALPNHASYVLYGALSEQALPVSPEQLIFRHKQVTGFWLPMWMRAASPEAIGQAWRDILSQPEIFTPVVAGEYPLEGIQQAIAAYTGGGARFSDGKVLLRVSAS